MKFIVKPVEFTQDIEFMVNKHGISYIEAIFMWCEIRNIEYESTVPLINKSQTLKSKLEAEAMDLNLIKKESRLDI